MIILRNKKAKFFANVPVKNDVMPAEQEQQASPTQPKPTSNEVLLEQMRLQKLLLQTQKQRQEIQAQESRDRLRQLSTAQRIEQKKDEQENKNVIKAKKIESDNNNSAKNVGLYKSRSTAVSPVPMKH